MERVLVNFFGCGDCASLRLSLRGRERAETRSFVSIGSVVVFAQWRECVYDVLLQRSSFRGLKIGGRKNCEGLVRSGPDGSFLVY